MKNVCYKTSRDMEHLVELLNEGKEVVCFITYDAFEHRDDREPCIITDVCIAKLVKAETQYYDEYLFCVRGHGYVSYYPNWNYSYTFLDLLKARDIQYIEPTL